MSDKTKTKNGDSGETNGMSDTDTKFLVECLKNTESNITVNTEAVAAALGYTNVKSVANKLGVMKKRYDLNITASNKATANSAAMANGGPATPAKSYKVTKSSTAPHKRGIAKKVTASKKGAKGSASEEADDERIKVSDITEEDVKGDEEVTTADEIETDADGKIFPMLGMRTRSSSPKKAAAGIRAVKKAAAVELAKARIASQKANADVDVVKEGQEILKGEAANEVDSED
ncbi:MAG: hypothetical protein M1827_003493 [Pycnora praestabilis]|nr:MAG: hypothetical protein M1827_003493 [Pycnora praestabilis]